ncbi:MAG: hypothetical protein B6I20_06085 [Bacteroidetes bacterium 4572_117]|nr:MAG: hypothetical protein B6I20_06085 [Bacteroidetes bacterium 4572_117]
MEILKYKESGLNPGVTLDIENGKFSLSGKSCPENVVEFYKPIMEWLEEYQTKPLDKTVFEFDLEYYNTASSKILFIIMQKLEAIKESGKDVLVKWYFPDDDEALEEAGEEYDDLIEVDFELIPTKSTD